ncbi:hypothetical protein GMA1_53 [Gordonia phage GMA1]|uniref:hypothetical protein n=1 Tax=Gordonia phage GMA1 TaxID=1647470 RepID=UPI0007B6472A|nr:hypothetical protein BH788_gp53 [Gordonia phage GMA1]AKJ72150.1 hypothetical protein GMA1_53 [Gordonia phage GMA1]
MTDEKHGVTARARAALDGITPGPWVRDNPDDRFSEHDDVFSGDVWSRRVAGLISRRADATFIAAAPDLVRDLADKVERQESIHKWPKTTPEGHLYVAPTTYAELCSRHTDAAQASVECWVDAECPPEPTWEMVGLAHREVERLTAERAERDQAIAAHQRAEARATLHREERVRRALGEADRD